MKQLRLAAFAFASALTVVHAQDERRAPPTEIPDFSNLDEYIYEPKSTVLLGFRQLSGAKTSFSGTGKIAPLVSPGPGPATGETNRTYDDGSVLTPQQIPRRDASGNLVDVDGKIFTDPATQTQAFDNPPAGTTNTWNFLDSRQLTDRGTIAFHTYSADITDPTERSQDSASTPGMELAVLRDMGKLFGTRVSWNLMAGMSVNDISASTSSNVRATIRTSTDEYSLLGQLAPNAPYSAPSDTWSAKLDESGNPVVIDGVTQYELSNPTVLLGNAPTRLPDTVATNDTSIKNHWKVKGAYFTFRAGPTFWIPISSRFRLSLSAGAALIYAGTTYTVTETFTPDIGSQIIETEEDTTNKLLPGYYVDASLQYDLTDRTGFYAGAVFQSAGDYTQQIKNATSDYSTKIDLSNQSGLRAGMTVRF